MRKIHPIALGALALGAIAAPLLAAPADQVRARIANYRELGAAFKAVNDGLRGSELQTVLIQQSARQIRNAARAQYTLFPAGSDASAGVRTAAKPEIWQQPLQFKTAQDNFARAADAFFAVASRGDADAIRTEARKLGGTCKGCHDTYRVPST
jgi:cytochrome c556